LGILFDDAIDCFHIQILVEVVISNVPGSIHYITEYPVLEYLYNVSVALTGTAPKLNTISPYRLRISIKKRF
jgi:hypothetical protein